MERITYIEVHQKSIDKINDLIATLTDQGLDFKEQNLAIISGCFIEMNGYLASIAESLRKEDEE